MNEAHVNLFERLTSGATFDELLAMVREYKKAGMEQRAIYDMLEDIWRELGCDDTEDCPHCDALGGLMDRVWGFCSSKDALWETSLSGKKVR